MDCKRYQEGIEFRFMAVELVLELERQFIPVVNLRVLDPAQPTAWWYSPYYEF